jgi:hypothetical protein
MAFESQCDGCKQWDTHPKAHFNTGGSFHHDCLPAQLRELLIETNPLTKPIIEAAEGGLRGEDLLAFIQELHSNLSEEE